MAARLHRMSVHLQRGVDHVDVGDVCRDQGVHRGSSGSGTVARHHNRRTNSPVEVSSAILMSSSSSGIDGAGPAGPVRGSVSGSPGMSGRCPCSGPGKLGGERHRGRRQQASVLTRVDAARGRGPCRRTPAPPCTRPGRRPRRRAGTAGACWSAAGRRRRCRHAGGQALRDELPAVGHAFRPARWRARSRCLRLRHRSSSSSLSSALMPRCPIR